MDANRRRTEIMQETLVKYRKGQIDKKQYLTQKKAILLEEQKEKQEEHGKIQAGIDSITRQLDEVESELAEI